MELSSAQNTSASAAGRRALKSAALDLLSALETDVEDLLMTAFESANTMTEQMAALDALGASGAAAFDEALAQFHKRWSGSPVVMDKWFSSQAAAPRADAMARIKKLRAHPDFDIKNPNRVRSLVMSLATRNPRAFHAADGSGYHFLAGLAGEVDPLNPALAARLLTPFESWRRFDSQRQEHARKALEHLASLPQLSKNTREMVERTLA